MSQVRQRMYYYRFVVAAALESLGVSTSKVTFVEESSYHFSREWILDQWRLCTLVPQQAVKDAWDRSYNPSILSPMFCPGIQTLAEEHLDIDFQFGGGDQVSLLPFTNTTLALSLSNTLTQARHLCVCRALSSPAWVSRAWALDESYDP